MKISYNKDSIIITVGPPRIGKTEMLRSKFPQGSIISVEEISLALSGIHKTKTCNAPLSRKKEELSMVLEVVKARASQGLLTVVVGVRSSTLLDAINTLANTYKRPVWFMIFDVDKAVVEDNNHNSIDIKLSESDLRIAMDGAMTTREHIIKTYPNKYDIISPKNWGFVPVIKPTEYIYHEKRPFMVVGDLHGNLGAYRYFEAIAKEHSAKMYLLGDVIDYGDDSCNILEGVLNNCSVVSLLGNHEKNLISIRDKGFDMASIVTAFTYKQLLLSNKRSIEYYVNALKRWPRIAEVVFNKKKYLLSHFTLTIDPYGDKSYQYRDQEVTGGTYFNYGDGSEAIIPPEYTNVYGHLSTKNPDINQICLNCDISRDGEYIYKALLVMSGKEEIITYSTKVQPKFKYPIVKGVDDVAMFPVMGYYNDLQGAITDPMPDNPRYAYVRHASLAHKPVYDRLLRCFVSIPPKLHFEDIGPIAPEVTQLVVSVCPNNLAGITNISILPERQILITGEHKNIIGDFINVGNLTRNMKSGYTVSLVPSYKNNKICGMYYLGSGLTGLDTVPDWYLANSFNSKTSVLANLRDAGVSIPRYDIIKKESGVFTLPNMAQDDIYSVQYYCGTKLVKKHFIGGVK